MTQLSELTAGGMGWQVVPQFRECLFGPEGLRLEEWLRLGLATIVKHGPHRTVYRVRLPGLEVHVKQYRLMDLRARLRELIRPAKAWTEFRRGLAVAERGIPTIEPLAVGRQPGRAGGPGESWLITRTLDGAEELKTFLECTLVRLPSAEQTHIRQELAGVLGRFMARLHEAGVVHHDLHVGNLLVRREADGELRLFLIDLHAARLGSPLSWPARRANLALLGRYFSFRSHRSDRLRFWQAYRDACSEPGAVIPHSAEAARDVERASWQSNLHFWRQRDARCLRTNRYYQRLRSDAVTGHAVRDLDGDLLAILKADPDALFHRPDVKLLKDSRSATVAELEMTIDGVRRSVIYKRFRATAWTDPFAALVRQPPALRSWIMGQGLRERGLPTPRPLAVLHRRQFGLPSDGYLLMEKVPEAVDLHAWLKGLGSWPASERRRSIRRMLDQVGGLIRDLHSRQLSHRDLKASNILLSVVNGPLPLATDCAELTRDQGQRTKDKLWLIDLVGVQRYGRLSESRKIQNLARLNASFHDQPLLTRTDRLRVLRVYLQWGLLGKGGWKRWWRRLAQATQTKIARNRRSGRPLG